MGSMPALAATWYVHEEHPLANNSNLGTVFQPWRTVQYAVNTAAAGDTIMVLGGDYAEGVTVNKRLTLIGQGARMQGGGNNEAFTIRANDVTIQGFEIYDYDTAFLPYNYAAYSRATIRDNYITGGDFGVWINGDAWLIEGNEINRLTYSGSGDADYMRAFGTNHVIRRNYIHGTNIPTDLEPSSGNDYAHTDCIQFYNNNGEILRDVLIEENIFTDFVQGLFIGNETGNGSSVQRITVRNNVFWGTSWQPVGNLLGSPSWGVYFGKNGPERQIVIENNLFRNISNAIGILTGTDAICRRNIISNSGTVYILEGTSPSLINTQPGGNLRWNNNWIGEFSPSGDISNVNPQYANINSLVGLDGVPFTYDDGWVSTNPLAAGYGPQMNLSNVEPNVDLTDSDGDGVYDFIEEELGTDPNDPFDFPFLPISRLQTGLTALFLLAAGMLALRRFRAVSH